VGYEHSWLRRLHRTTETVLEKISRGTNSGSLNLSVLICNSARENDCVSRSL
jgi:hypothetical protein